MILKLTKSAGKWCTFGIGALVLLSFFAALSINIAAIFNYEGMNNLYHENAFVDGENVVIGLVEALNGTMSLLWVEGGITSLLILESFRLGNLPILPLIYVCIVIYLFDRSRHGESKADRIMYASVLCMLLYLTINVNVAQIGDWRAALSLQPYHIAELVNFSYWGSVQHWINGLSGYGMITIGFVVVAVMYTAAKTHVIAKSFATSEKDYRALISSCCLAAGAPYRLSQAYDLTKRLEVTDKTNDVREETLKTLMIKPHQARLINGKIERAGLTCLSDHSASYIIEAVK